MKYKIGDMVVVKSIRPHWKNNVVAGKIHNVYPELGLYNIEINGGHINLFASEIELDKEYYRNIKLKDILE